MSQIGAAERAHLNNFSGHHVESRNIMQFVTLVRLDPRRLLTTRAETSEALGPNAVLVRKAHHETFLADAKHADYTPPDINRAYSTTKNGKPGGGADNVVKAYIDLGWRQQLLRLAEGANEAIEAAEPAATGLRTSRRLLG
jgi:hypothetical protein